MKDGYVNFKSRNWSFKGDRGTWAKVSTPNPNEPSEQKLTVSKARKGIISSEYTNEIRDFCKSYGIDFDKMHPGDCEVVSL